MFSKQVQLCSIGADNKIRFTNPNIALYPDGITNVKGDDIFRSGNVLGKTMVLRPKDLVHFTTAMYLVDAMNERHRGYVNRLVLPSIPGARQDRLNPAGDLLFTAKSIAADINRRGFDEVVVLDPHSNVASGFIDRCKVKNISDVFRDYTWTRFDGVIAPDAGAGHRAQNAADALARQYGHGVKVVQASKNRDVETGKLSGFSVNVEAGKHYLVVDDICDGGGTFVGLGQKIKEQGAEASLFVSHGIFSKGEEKLAPLYKTITTTDSTLFLDPRNTGVHIIPITERLIRS